MKTITTQQKAQVNRWFRQQSIDHDQQKAMIENYCKATGYHNTRPKGRNWRPSREHQWRLQHVIATWRLFEAWCQMYKTADAAQDPEG